MATYFVRPLKPLKNGKWRVQQEVWIDGKRKHLTVPHISYEHLGFSKKMTVEEAKARASQLNSIKSMKRKEYAAAVNAARRLDSITIVQSAYLPKPFVEEFILLLREKNFGSEAHLKRIVSHWNYIQKMIKTLRLEPKDYIENKERIYNYFIHNKNSLDYSKKLLRILNLWGIFVSKKQGSPFEPVPHPKNNQRNKIAEAYQDSDKFVGESDPLKPDFLESVKSKLTVPGNYEWLYISVWFGLRPNEIDNLKKSSNWRIEKDHDVGVDVLWVYQSKLTSIEREKRWKPIPVILKQQEKALEFIQEQSFKRPILKTFHNVFGARHITSYAGRKGFIDLMLDNGQKLEDISTWMGHQNIEITWRKYRNKKRVSFTRLVKHG